MTAARAVPQPSQATTDYQRVEAAIRFLDQEHSEQPTLAEVAAEVGLSEFHFQRLFQRWAGISPKRFLQFCTAGAARTLLEKSATVLEASDTLGLSGGGRLHDLTVAIQAMTPGEVARQGAGLSIRFGVAGTPLGRCLIAATPRGVCRIGFVEDEGEAPRVLAREWPRATLVADDPFAESLGKRLLGWLEGRVTAADSLSLHVKGTNFQIRVWEALLRIPPANLASYGGLARALGTPSAARAVGTAVAANPVAVLIPCHRVIRNTGAFGGYRWGEPRKRALIALEASRS